VSERDPCPARLFPCALGAALVLVVLQAASCGETADGPTPWFVESGGQRGLDFEHRRGDKQRFWFPEIMGAGVALLDHDGDGDLDVYLVQSGDLARPGEGRNRLFLNAGDGTFSDVTEASGAGDGGYGMGVCAGDYDLDGDTDLYVTNVGRNTLLRNEGDGRFTDVTEAAGVGHAGWGTSAAFLDGDGDGDLDLFVVNYLFWSIELEVECLTATGRDYCSPNSYAAPAADALYENLGDGTFRDVSLEAGVNAAVGNGLGVAVGDFDGDGRTDIYVANDMMPNQLWINTGGLTFRDDALLAGCAANMDGESEAGMGAVAFDHEDDGDLDLFLTHLREETNTLYVNEGGLFRDRTAPLGLAAPSLRHTGFGVALADFDQDGTRDAFVANGSVTANRPPERADDPYAEADQLFRGLPGGGFEEVLPAGGTSPTAIETGRGAAAGDLDGDGDLDLIVVDSAARVRLLENVAATGSWIAFDVENDPGRTALGAEVVVEAAGLVRRRRVAPAMSYCSSAPERVHVGLGAFDEPVAVRVRWPDGTEEAFGALASGALHTLRRGAGR